MYDQKLFADNSEDEIFNQWKMIEFYWEYLLLISQQTMELVSNPNFLLKFNTKWNYANVDNSVYPIVSLAWL